MDDKRKKDIIRCTLQSYIGKTKNETVMGEHQKAAVIRLSNMKEERFEQLCLDLINEIQRRNGLSFDTPSVLGAKLLMISDVKFRNLVMETLTVFYYKNTQYKSEEMPEFLENMKRLISDLKTQSEKEIFLNQVENLSFYNKIYELLDFIKRRGIDELIILKMKQFVDQKVKEDSWEFIEALEFPETFLEAFVKSEIFEQKIKKNPTTLENFKKLHDEIIFANSFTDVDLEERSQIIKQNMSGILAILVENIAIPSKKIEYFENEISGVVQVLEEIEEEIQNKKEMDLNLASTKLSGILNNIISKGSNLSSVHVGELKIQQISVELISNTLSRTGSFKLVLDIAKDIRKALACI